MTHFFLALIAIGYLIYRAITDKSFSNRIYFDYEMFGKDVNNGVPQEEIQRRKKRGYYNFTYEEMKAKEKAKEVIPGVVDIEWYEYDRKRNSKQRMDELVSYGWYKYMKPKRPPKS